MALYPQKLLSWYLQHIIQRVNAPNSLDKWHRRNTNFPDVSVNSPLWTMACKTLAFTVATTAASRESAANQIEYLNHKSSVRQVHVYKRRYSKCKNRSDTGSLAVLYNYHGEWQCVTHTLPQGEANTAPKKADFWLLITDCRRSLTLLCRMHSHICRTGIPLQQCLHLFACISHRRSILKSFSSEHFTLFHSIVHRPRGVQVIRGAAILKDRWVARVDAVSWYN